jgi:hypothetical protein
MPIITAVKILLRYTSLFIVGTHEDHTYTLLANLGIFVG